MNRTLGSLQVAALLVSASYGIGFLFGSGELALSHGMAGSIYGVATGFGMLVLAAFARQLWATGLPVWDLFGRAYGKQLQGVVALLSLIWMSGVLAAQIQGGVAVLELLGLEQAHSYLTILLLIYGASRLDLRFASALFATCLLASAAVLIYALVVANGMGVYLQAIPAYTEDLSSFSPSRLVAISLAVGLLVCTGADYQQFVLAARSPLAAVGGCVLAGLLLFVIAFLPSAVVVAMQGGGMLGDLVDTKQVVPWVLGQVAGSVGQHTDKLMLIALSVAALGAGAAILRAMTEALACAASGSRSAGHPLFALIALGLSALLASRDQGIVDTMVSVNVVYIASIGVCFATMVLGIVVPPQHARWIVAVGFAGSVAVHLAGWLGQYGEDTDMVSLLLGCFLSACTALWLRFGAGGWARRWSNLRR
jgi:solute:Na+ symporter, SSS family